MNMTKNSTFSLGLQCLKLRGNLVKPGRCIARPTVRTFLRLEYLARFAIPRITMHSSDTPSEPPTSKPYFSSFCSFSLVTLRFGITIPGSVTAVNTHVDKHTIATTPCDDVFVKSKTIKPKNAHKEHVEKTHTGAK